ncbi:CHASE2 domain-containing protein [Erythrobacter sp. SCSIO 43205]|uniref:CHASE2 domain-containing protein n=1 Tax=Erythrobacter sp. SCSIO 43205 TaxID=2779361 RepID=UPI001CA9A3FF|nr:CHASE2 domain-containing protein [Erythrobacter sp. SCSIO 43205]UAB77659.1 CHASE2 domain-containing protein [Erythrobacter sp. SCSIO 43205]
MLKTRLFAEWFVLFTAMLALLFAAQLRGWTERFDLALLDLEASINTPAIDPRIILVEIDDPSLEEVGAWPWDRAIHAELIRRIDSYSPAAIGYDVLFIEGTDEASDAALASALADSGKVVLPHSFGPKPNTVRGEVPLYPLPMLRDAASAVGHVALTPDADGVARRFELVRGEGGEGYPHFSVRLLEIAGELQSYAVSGPFRRQTSAIVRYGARGSVSALPASAVLSGSVPPEFFKGAIVFVGATSPGLGDRYSVPAHAGRLLTGAEMQAHLANAMLSGNLIEKADTRLALALQAIVIALLFASFWRLSPRSALIVAILLTASLFVGSILSLTVFNIWLPVGGALLAIVIAYPLWGWRRLASVSRFLESEAASLRELARLPTGRTQSGEGFDVVAQQVALLKRLTKGVSSNLKLIQDVIDADPDVMLVTDGDGRVTMGNFAAENLFGAAPKSKNFTLDELFAQVDGILDKERDELNLADGRSFWMASAHLDEDVGSKVLSLREVTEIKKAERQRRETLEFLSHDMRSPQVAIISLARQADEALSIEERFARITEQSRRTLKLTEDFVQIARISNEGVEREETELGSIVQEAADRAYPLARKYSVKVLFDPPGEPVFAYVDGFAIARMLDNLISNAVKYSPEGGQILITLDEGDGEAFEISVADTGPGLSPERKQAPFARFGARDTSKGPSSGLGLAYVKQVVDRHGGTISVESEEGKGTRFVIHLPYQ